MNYKVYDEETGKVFELEAPEAADALREALDEMRKQRGIPRWQAIPYRCRVIGPDTPPGGSLRVGIWWGEEPSCKEPSHIWLERTSYRSESGNFSIVETCEACDWSRRYESAALGPDGLRIPRVDYFSPVSSDTPSSD